LLKIYLLQTEISMVDYSASLFQQGIDFKFK
jgi:hypothetical protein